MLKFKKVGSRFHDAGKSVLRSKVNESKVEVFIQKLFLSL